MNKVILVGRLCNNPEIRYVDDKNSAVTSFSLAVNRNYKNSEGSYDCDFVDCDLWGKRAEIFCQYITKGRLVGIEGSLRLNKFTNENGENRYKIKVNVNEFYFMPSNAKRNTDNTTFNGNDVFTEEVFDGEISESDIPF
ncbi:single-stranded DNA-binding protein [Terrisporobacter sp.]